MSRARPVESVCICIITFQRPVSLRRTLEGLAKVVVPESVVCRAVVVDNDQDGEAAKVLVELIESFDFEIIVIEEAERGIPFARNAAVANAAGSDAPPPTPRTNRMVNNGLSLSYTPPNQPQRLTDWLIMACPSHAHTQPS